MTDPYGGHIVCATSRWLFYERAEPHVENSGQLQQRNYMSVKVAITIGPFEFVAAMEEQAPLTCAAFREILPFQAKTIHVRWSGESVWVPLGDARIVQEF